MSLRKIFSVCACGLMLLSFAPSVNASSVKSNDKSTRISRHAVNIKRANHIKSIHQRNVRRIQRIKRHLLNHQKNLMKLSKRIHRTPNHQRNAKLLERLNNDKARLIKVIQSNERGMVRLAERVANEEHQINLIRHPENSLRPAKSTTVHLPKINSNQDSQIEHSVMTVINEVNGKLTRYVAKDSTSKRNQNQSSYCQYSDVNGHYSATPDQINRAEISRLNQQVSDQIQNTNQLINQMNQDFNSIF